MNHVRIVISATVLTLLIGAVVVRLASRTENDCGCEAEKKEKTGINEEQRMQNRYAPLTPEQVAAERRQYIDAYGSFAGLGVTSAAPRPPVGRWNSIGPYGMIQTTDELFEFSGKILSVAQYSDYSSIVYVGASNGGVWKSTDAGSTWFSIFDSIAVPCVTTIGTSAFFQDSIVWIGTGQRAGEDGRVAPGLVYRSSNGGITWTRVTSIPGTPTTISKIVVDFWRKSYVYVANSNGLYISTNGGFTWDQVISGDVCDVVVNSDILDASKTVINAAVQRRFDISPLGGLYRSTDGGTTFNSSPIVLPDLDPNVKGRISLTNGRSHTAIYASVSNDSGGLFGVWQSLNTGATWKQKTSPFVGGQGFRNNAIAVDPDDPGRVLLGWNLRGIYVTTDGGGTWNPGSPVHEDIQQMAFDRQNRKIVYHVRMEGFSNPLIPE
jgi:photosystem II stability/assembly factor-like uncharacterized protein